jgi:hypothetical protein
MMPAARGTITTKGYFFMMSFRTLIKPSPAAVRHPASHNP